MDGFPEPLEKIFQKVEEENERRAQEALASGSRESTELCEDAVTPVANQAKRRRRGSISITRFGQLADDYLKGSRGPPTPTLSTIPSRSALYQLQAANESTQSFASGSSAHVDDEGAHIEDDHVTHMHQISGRQSISRAMGSLLPRRLSRARSANILVGEANVMIGVSVEEATEESAEGVEASQTIIHAPGALRNQPSRLTMAGSSPARNDWVAKAKRFTQKFRRKSKAAGLASPL